MRTFVAIDIPKNIKDTLASMINDLKRVNADCTWVNPQSIHLTLKFIGETEPNKIADIDRICDSVRSKVNSFTLSTNLTGVFPDYSHPKVLWIGLKGEIYALESLQQQIETELNSVGFENSDKKFHPHITLARIKSNKNSHALITQAELYNLPEFSFKVNEFKLMESILDPSGAIYKDIASYQIS